MLVPRLFKFVKPLSDCRVYVIVWWKLTAQRFGQNGFYRVDTGKQGFSGAPRNAVESGRHQLVGQEGRAACCTFSVRSKILLVVDEMPEAEK